MKLDVNVLVNKDNPLDLNYIPDNLYIVDDNKDNFHNYKDPNLKPMLRKDIKNYIDMLLMDAKKLGFSLIVDSGYRSSSYQQVILEKLIEEKGMEAYKLVALPGMSEHQTGLAVDFAYYKDGVYDDDVKEDDKEAIWLKNNSWKYGFILRYPKGKEDITGYNFEPWHFRFVGLELAKKLYDEDITLEEYYKKSKIIL